MNTTRLITALGLALSVAGCGPAPSSSTQKPSESLPTIAADEPQAGATGTPIDPSKKTVVIVTPAGAARTSEQALTDLQAQNAKTGDSIQARMRAYSESLGDNQKKERLAKEMSDDLEAYKKQSLEMYRLQQRQGEETRETPE